MLVNKSDTFVFLVFQKLIFVETGEWWFLILVDGQVST